MPEPAETGRSIPIDSVAALYRSRLEHEQGLSLSLAAQVRELIATVNAQAAKIERLETEAADAIHERSEES